MKKPTFLGSTPTASAAAATAAAVTAVATATAEEFSHHHQPPPHHVQGYHIQFGSPLTPISKQFSVCENQFFAGCCTLHAN